MAAIGRLFTSVRLAIILMLIITALSLLGALLIQVPAIIADNPDLYGQWVDSVARAKVGGWAGFLSALGLFDVFHSIWFIIAGVLLILNIIFCNISRWSSIRTVLRGSVINLNDDFYSRSDTCVEMPVGTLSIEEAAAVSEKTLKAQRYRIQTKSDGDIIYQAADKNRVFRLGTYASHLSIIIFIFAFVAGNYFGFTDYDFAVPENGIRNVGHDTDLSLALISFTDEYYQDGRPKDFRSDVVLYENGKVVATETIRVNHPLIYNGIRFYQSYYGPAVDIGVNDDQGNEIFSGGVALDRTLTSSGYLHYVGSFNLANYGVTVRIIKSGSSSGSPMIPADSVAVDIRLGGSQVDLQLIDLGVPQVISGLEFTYLGDSEYSGFQLSRDPTNSLIWVASALFIIGICAVLYFPYRQYWVRISSQGDEGRLVIRTSGSRRSTTAHSFEKMVARIQEEIKKKQE
ncbi:MAG: cytochrome c biogenesis protein ResB [Dehalococcoidia bacterium]